VTKCLRAGQQCKKSAVSDYPKYGFVCAKHNGVYVLSKK
jgi:hypothetical protein